VFERAAAEMERAHAEDPRTLENGVPWSVHYHQRLVHWIEVLDPEASAELRLAARAAHIRRWTIPRDAYEEGRTGYKRWRSELARFHAEEAGRIMQAAGFDRSSIERVQAILQKRRLKQDPDVQTFEDGLCLVFLENELADFAEKHEEEKVADIIRKTWEKMSERGHAVALELAKGLPARLERLLQRALQP
jgi:hypothetical protein